MNLQLAISNIAFGVSFILSLGFGFWALLKSPKKIQHITFFLSSLAVAAFEITHLVATNISDPILSRNILLGNMTNIFIACFLTHWVLTIIGLNEKRKFLLIANYAAGVALFIFYLLDTTRFMLPSSPKLYFVNYYNGGEYYWLMLVYFFANVFYQLAAIARVYFKTPDRDTKTKYLLFGGGIGVGYFFGSFCFPLVLDIQVDPIYASVFALYSAPLAYSMIRYNLLEVKAAIQRALIYAFLVSGIGFLVSGINWGQAYIERVYPGVPGWTVPLLSAILAVFAGGVVWEKVKELDVLKYEFITVVTHKFRTPLTRIKWALEVLKGKQADEHADLAVSDIAYASESLVELTDTLVDLTKTSQTQYVYTIDRVDFAERVRSITSLLSKRFDDKKIHLTISCPFADVLVLADSRRITFALQILIENAVAYTPEGGSVQITVGKDAKTGFVSVKDSGIGISKEEKDMMLTRFWRSSNAKKMDTEGMGIGLYMANQIIQKHRGSLTISSEGEGKGSVFTLNLPLA